MSFQIETAFVKQFNSTVDLLLQQKGSRLRSCVTEESMHGEEQFFEQVGTVAAQEVTTRHGDSPLISTPHDRRRVTLRFFEWGDLIDKRTPEDRERAGHRLREATLERAYRREWAQKKYGDERRFNE